MANLDLKAFFCSVLFFTNMPSTTAAKVLEHPWQPYVFGAPCSVSLDWENGHCKYEHGLNIEWKGWRKHG